MAKSTALNFTQNLKNTFVEFCSSDLLKVIAVSPNNNGSNLTNGLRTFTATAGTIQTGGTVSTWTATVTDSRVIGSPTLTNGGTYLTTPTATGNAAIVDSGSSNATFNLRVEFYKELYTSSTDDAIVKGINVTSLDTSARVVSLWLVDTNENRSLIVSINVPISSGTSGTAAAVDLLSGTLLLPLPYDANGKRVLPLKAGQKIGVSVPAITAGTKIFVTAFIEEY